MARFTVVSMVREDPEVLRVFCSYYTRCGAERIVIYYDGTRDEAAPLSVLRDIGPVEIIPCDEEFWATHPGGRPSIVSDRQCEAFSRTYADCTSDWMLPCDADELLLLPRDLGAWLQEVPREMEAVRFPTAEAVWGPGEDIEAAFGTRLFRLVFPDMAMWQRDRLNIYGPAGLIMKQGVAGQELGKYILRTGCDNIRIQIHRVQRDGQDITVPVEQICDPEDRIYLGHFDAISFSRWRFKLSRFGRKGKTLSKVRGRRRILRVLVYRLGHFGPRPLRWLFRKLYCLSPRQVAELSARGLLIERDLFAENPAQVQTANPAPPGSPAEPPDTSRQS
jgi:hypothetical protein